MIAAHVPWRHRTFLRGGHPFRALPPGTRLPLAFASSIIALVLHRRQAVQATTPQAPHGTLSFALAGKPDEAERIRSSWSRSTRDAVKGNLRGDMVFSLAWTNAIALAGLWAADQMGKYRWSMGAMGNGMAWIQWLAAVLAVVKDRQKRRSLRGRSTRLRTRTARWVTISEITLKGLGILYVVAGGVAWGRRQRDT